MSTIHKADPFFINISSSKEKTVIEFISSRCTRGFMDAESFLNILNTLVIATIVIFAVCLGSLGYFNLKERLAARK